MSSLARSTVSPAKLVAKWNQSFPIGQLVRYWTGLRDGIGIISHTRSKAEVLGGHTAVVWIDGCSGCVALSHIEPLVDSAA
jgi:hypothetical protein